MLRTISPKLQETSWRLRPSAETIFTEFSQSGMVNDEELSLFQGIAGSAFGNYFQPDFVPVFVAPTLVGAELEAACSFATTDSIREGCIFDIAVPGDAETMAAVTEIAEAEQRERVAVISNSLPQLADSSVRLELRSGEAASVDIMANDAERAYLPYPLHSNMFFANRTYGRQTTIAIGIGSFGGGGTSSDLTTYSNK